jgi:hypothetical protein
MTHSAGSRPLDCPEARIALGVYVLGAIDPAEQALVDAHLDTCDACLAEMAELADLMPLLALVPAEEAVRALEAGEAAGTRAAGASDAPRLAEVVPITEAPRAAASEASQDRLATGNAATVHDLSAARSQRRWLARAGAVAAAAAVVGAASFGGVRLAAGSSGQDPHNVVGVANGPWQTGYGSSGTVTGTVAYRSIGWGTQLAAKVAGLPLGTPCQLWVVEGNGTRVQAGSWDTDASEGAVWYPGSAQVAATAIKSFVITIAGRQPVTIAAS